MKAFYQDDANSRVLPGKKDVPSSRIESNNKVKMRKQLLLDDIDNLYSKFINSYPNHKIGRSKFFSLRPNWLLPVQAQSQEVSKCIYHENIDLVCTVLTNFSRSKQIQIDLKSFASADNLVKTTVCDIFDKNCVWRNCDNCSINNIYKLFEPLQTFYNDQITIYQWVRVLLEKEGNSLKVTQKAPQSKCIDEVINMLENQLQSFSIHQHTLFSSICLSTRKRI